MSGAASSTSAVVDASNASRCPHRAAAATATTPCASTIAWASAGAVTLAAVAGWCWYRRSQRTAAAANCCGGTPAAADEKQAAAAAATAAAATATATGAAVVASVPRAAPVVLSADLQAQARARGFTPDIFPLNKLLPAESSDPSRPLVVLVSCGSFSPVTYLHLRIFEMARDALQLAPTSRGGCDVIGGYLSPVHDAYGKKSLVPAHHRVAMCQAAVADSCWLAVSQWEVAHPDGWQRTAPVLDAYAQWLNDSVGATRYGGRPIRVMMLCGADLLETFLVPNLWSDAHMRQLLTQGLAVLTRQGTDLSSLLAKPLFAPYAHNVHVVPVTIENSISSTSVRDVIARGGSLKYLIPDGAAAYIYAHRLYHPAPDAMAAAAAAHADAHAHHKQKPASGAAAAAAGADTAAGSAGAAAGAAASASDEWVDPRRHVLLANYGL